MSMLKNRRLTKELAKLTEQTPAGITLVSADDLEIWYMDVRVLDENPIYADQVFRLRFRFSSKYPIEAPEVHFMPLTTPVRPIPIHPHIYSNGIVCLDLLGASGWSPVQNVESICMSLQSMLTGNTKRERPEGDEEFCRRTRVGMSTRGMGFVYDDETV